MKIQNNLSRFRGLLLIILTCSAGCLLWTCDLVPKLVLNAVFQGYIDDTCEEDYPYYYCLYKAAFDEGQVYTAELASFDEVPIHLHIEDFDFDMGTSAHDVATFTASSGGEIYFTVYLHRDYVYGKEDYAFTIREGINGPAVIYSSDAARVAQSIVDDFFRAVPWLSSQTCSNKIVDGAVGGTVTVNGTFTKTMLDYNKYKYEYTNMRAVFTDYQSLNENPALSGTASITGAVTVTSSSSGSSYSGSWNSTGTLTLEGIYNDTVSYSFTHYRDYPNPWAGSLTGEGGQFSLVSEY